MEEKKDTNQGSELMDEELNQAAGGENAMKTMPCPICNEPMDFQESKTLFLTCPHCDAELVYVNGRLRKRDGSRYLCNPGFNRS